MPDPFWYADRAVALGDLGVRCEVDGRLVRVLWGIEEQEALPFEAEADGTIVTVRARAEDVSAVVEGDVVRKDGETYYVTRRRPDGISGWVLLDLADSP